MRASQRSFKLVVRAPRMQDAPKEQRQKNVSRELVKGVRGLRSVVGCCSGERSRKE